MKRRVLTSSLVTEKIIFFLLMVSLLLFSLKHYPELLWILAPAFLYFDFMLYYRPVQMEFEDNKLFIKRKKAEEMVALKSVYLVKKTSFGIGYKNVWKIKYMNVNGESVAYFYPRSTSSAFDEFIKLVQAVNRNAEVNV